MISSRLTAMSANCGGKTSFVTTSLRGKTKAYLRFSCRDDAMRCLQRIDGQEVFGSKIQVKLFERDLKAVQTSAQTLTQQNLAKTRDKTKSPSLLALNTLIPKSVETSQSVIIGLSFKPSDDAKEVVRSLVQSWNDTKLKPELILNVQKGAKTGKGKEKFKLFVTATTPQTNKALVIGSKKYLKPETGVKWFVMQQKSAVPLAQNNGKTSTSQKPIKSLSQKQSSDENRSPDDCLSIIRGLMTTSGQNVAKTVRKIVEQWNDRSVHPNFIKTVERDSKYAEKDGLVLLFVTAQTPEKSLALVSAAEKYLTATDAIQWTAYRKKRHISKEMDSDSNFDDFEFIPSQSSSTQDVSQPTVQQISKNKKKAAVGPVGDDHKSVILGLETKRGDNLAKIVRKVIMDWKDRKLNGNFIQTVERFPGFDDTDRKVPLLVTATTPQMCKSLVSGAQLYLDPKGDVIWTHFSSEQKLSPEVSPTQEGDRQTTVVEGFDPEFSAKTKSEPSFVASVTEQTTTHCPVLSSTEDTIDVKKVISCANGFIAQTPLALLGRSSQPMVAPKTPPIRSVPNTFSVDEKADISPKPLFKSWVKSIESLFSKSPKSKASDLSVPSKLVMDLKPILFPVVPFTQYFGDGLTEGQSLSISGSLTESADCFTIDFFADSDIAFHFTVQVRDSLVVRNTRTEGCWGWEERQTPDFPFIAGSFFGLIVRLRSDRYVVEVNGEPFCEYKHRMSLGSVNGLSITGDVVISCLSFGK